MLRTHSWSEETQQHSRNNNTGYRNYRPTFVPYSTSLIVSKPPVWWTPHRSALTTRAKTAWFWVIFTIQEARNIKLGIKRNQIWKRSRNTTRRWTHEKASCASKYRRTFVNSQPTTPDPCFTPLYFTPFGFNAPSQLHHFSIRRSSFSFWYPVASLFAFIQVFCFTLTWI